MHPQAVPPFPTNYESFAAGLHENNNLGPQQYYPHDTDATRQCSFPIRTSRSSARSAPAGPIQFYASLPEHNLRRKTPNGTIDAGYDGSPTQLSPSSRPLKHMILTAPLNSNNSLRSANPLSFQTVTQPETFIAQGPTGDDRVDWTPRQAYNGSDISLQHGYGAFSFMNRYPFQFDQQLHVYQPVIPSNEHNVRAFCPPPAPVNESLPFGNVKWQTNYPPRHYQNFPKHPFMNPDASNEALVTQHKVWPSLNNRATQNVPLNVRHNTYLNSHHISTPTEAALGHDIFGGHNPTYPQFKDKALLQAHKSYADLLVYLQATKRLHPGRTGSSGQQSSRLFIYPKPPKPTVKEQAFSNVGSTCVGKLCRSQDVDYQYRSQHPTLGPYKPSLAGPHFCSQAPGYKEPDSIFAGRDERGALSLVGHIEQGFPAPFPNPPPQAHSSTYAQARSSLQLIQDLCEQSDWKWIDGLLLAGCLQYGLEQYDDALQSFARITAINPSHIEAIANSAATLYCLNRQAEAEERWLEAVKLRPDYLEAAEHLVGLLYRKRSKEAVDIIDHVQRALKLSRAHYPPTDTPLTLLNTLRKNDRNFEKSNDFTHEIPASEQIYQPSLDESMLKSQTTGFGSSGYALPGEENGRILALVHAKGTMLYSLRDIGRASEAFEEAVLISVGRCMSGIQDLVQRIRAVLSAPQRLSTSIPPSQSLLPLLLPPEKARITAQLVFQGTGELPGLVHVPDGGPKRAAVQTTSNSLLSLAKIFQDSVSSGATDPNKLGQPSGVGDILALYYLSLSLQESPSTANNVGILLAGVQHVAITQTIHLHGPAPPQPSMPGIPPGSGLALALAYYHYGLRLDPKHVHLHTNLGSLLKDIGQLDLAIQMYERAVSCDGTFDIALTNLANAVKDRGRIKDAINYYRRAVASNPSFAEAVCGLLTALNSVCDWRGRGGVMLASGKYDRWHVNDEGILLDARTQGVGSGLTKRAVDIVRQQLEEASHWGRFTLQEDVVRTLADELQNLCDENSFQLDQQLRSWTGDSWEGTRLIRLLERAARVLMRKTYMKKYVLQTTDTLQRSRPRPPPSLTIPSAPTVLPFHTFTTPLGARDIRTISQRNALRISCSTLRSSWLPPVAYPPPSPPNPCLNVGYVSSDFNNHPLAHLMQSVFGFHDRKRVNAICYATTPSDKSVHRIKIEREAPVFRDVSSWPPDKLVEQIIKDEIHILVNLNGYTRGARNEIFAARPAPIQMSFMGFAGTMGAEWCDYILADTTAIPPSTLRPWRNNVSIEDVFKDKTEDDDDHEWVYSENIIFCRDTFFCCDHAQSCEPDERSISWSEEERRRWEMRKELFPSMSDDTIIMGNFNQLYKIEPTTFRTWLRILARVPKAVLWLLRFPEIGEANLRRTAEAWAGPEVAGRLIFTDVAPKSKHISRARVCDLFLDTPECNAHTTAADVLWSSTPLLTLPRYSYKMCSRMAASILKGALPKTEEGREAANELIATDEDQYERTAIRLASGLVYTSTGQGHSVGSGRLATIRKLLWDSKWSCGLFDTHRWVNDVETAYEEAWRRFVTGQGGDIYL
ncbi:UDP-N-acetylglucosamine--peptide N-acetylglucosaminyltransferase SEC [Paramyrothecium foliicola]|nr:UDP-N-acetylglucosamine--peptide N-acetylglucosaminyltransferase SEC [Paramyrothecium foliicola]